MCHGRETARWAPGLAYQEIHMKRSVVEVDRLLQELLPPLQLTDEAVVAAVVDVLGQRELMANQRLCQACGTRENLYHFVAYCRRCIARTAKETER